MRQFTVLCAFGLLVLAAPAEAGLPTGKATYAGKVTLGEFATPPSLTLKVAKSRNRMQATLTCGGKRYTLKNISIDTDGHFDKTGPVGGFNGTIDGIFTSARNAEGSFASLVCDVGDSAAFKVKRKG